MAVVDAAAVAAAGDATVEMDVAVVVSAAVVANGVVVTGEELGLVEGDVGDVVVVADAAAVAVVLETA